MGNVRQILNPQSVALIGATEKEGSIGRAVLNNLTGSTNRPLYYVNPNRQTILGQASYPHIGDVPSPVSLAVIVTPTATVPKIVEDCGQAGVGGLIIISSGFGEAGPEGEVLEKEIVQIRKEYGLRIIGPNCLGVIRPHIGLNATFLPTQPQPGKIALISQSGALGDAILDWGASAGIGFSLFASLGSMIDVGFGDLIDFLNDDFNTKSIMLYMENVGDARRFISAARGFALQKPIVVLKPGRFAESRRAITSHTGGRPGDDRVYDAVFKRVGLVRVKEVADLFNVAEVLDSRYLPHGPRLGIISNAGGVGIIATDCLAELGGVLARLSEKSVERLAALSPGQVGRDNPIDMPGDADIKDYINTVKICLEDEGVDGVLIIYTPRAVADPVDLARAVIEMAHRNTKPLIAAWMGGTRAVEGRLMLLRANLPAYKTPEEAVKTYLHMYQYQRNIELLYETPVEVGQGGPRLKNYLKTMIKKAFKEKARVLPVKQALDLLVNYRIPTAESAIVPEVARIPKKVREMGLPLVLSVRDTPGGDVFFLPLLSEADVVRACQEAASRIGPDGEILLQKVSDTSKKAFTLLSRRDPDFGTVIVLKREIRLTEESTNRVSIGLPPLNQTLTRRILEELGLTGSCSVAGEGRETLPRLEELLVGFSNLIVDFPEIEKMDLVLSLDRTSLVVSDATIRLADHYSGSSLYPHLVISPYPSRYTETWTLRDGTQVLLRPIRPEDEPLGREMLANVSKENLRVRFFTVQKITHDLLIRFCNIDYDREIGIVAEIGSGDDKKMIGGARLIREPDTSKAEFALLVRDDYQSMGVGAKLIDILIGIGHDKGVDEIYGIVLTENEKMIELAKKLGFEVTREPDGISRVRLSLKPHDQDDRRP